MSVTPLQHAQVTRSTPGRPRRGRGRGGTTFALPRGAGIGTPDQGAWLDVEMSDPAPELDADESSDPDDDRRYALLLQGAHPRFDAAQTQRLHSSLMAYATALRHAQRAAVARVEALDAARKTAKAQNLLQRQRRIVQRQTQLVERELWVRRGGDAASGPHAPAAPEPLFGKPKPNPSPYLAASDAGAAATPLATAAVAPYAYTDSLEDRQRTVWADIMQVQLDAAYRAYTAQVNTSQTHLKRQAQVIAREVRRTHQRQLRTAATKDLGGRGRRAMREMLSFWKRNEREEREARKRAEKEVLERQKREEEEREAKRQQRKLNFLITQTELYSHFIGGKNAAPTAEAGAETGEADDGPVDFDEEDEGALAAQARRSAQRALDKQRDKTRAFDAQAAVLRHQSSHAEPAGEAAMDFLNPSSMKEDEDVAQPAMLRCQLKSYQLKGLNWLANLYEQGINGILADEMGLGKTVQSISLMAYLAERHNIWGPFLVITPVSTLHNWQQEIMKFAPELRPLPYWGSQGDRKVLRQFWNRKKLYSRDAPFHILVTSYQLVVTDEKYFQKVKWQYMVLDEAQAIKSSSSQRWNVLLKFNCRNRLLLTGTPIQNSMQELWALLHFIMPTLFDSHEEFSDWFAKDIESHSKDKGGLDEHQLRRLHMILKPFMLRRVKRDVQNELGEKIEVELMCPLSVRQRRMYRALKERIKLSELLERVKSLGDSDAVASSLMNLIMQFRKVCNHPELFERAQVASPLLVVPAHAVKPVVHLRADLDVPLVNYALRAPVGVRIPRLVAEMALAVVPRELDVWGAQRSLLKRLGEPPVYSALGMALWCRRVERRRDALVEVFGEDAAGAVLWAATLGGVAAALARAQRHSFSSVVAQLANVGADYQRTSILTRASPAYTPPAEAAPAELQCDNFRAFAQAQKRYRWDPLAHALFYGVPRLVPRPPRPEWADALELLHEIAPHGGLLGRAPTQQGFSRIVLPSLLTLIAESGKLQVLDQLLPRLKSEGHRVLIYFQMTRMIDLMEEYLTYRQHSYLRLDGSTSIGQRRDMVHDFQTRGDIFIFLLSTRAGGLGINLTAADTVVFYDSDWNPTVDQQAMDRAHRLGQMRQVTVYRLITQGTVEERILVRARQKDRIQRTVISGGDFKQADLPNASDMMSLLLDDEDLKRAQDEEADASLSAVPGRGSASAAANASSADQAAGAGEALPFLSRGSRKSKKLPRGEVRFRLAGTRGARSGGAAKRSGSRGAPSPAAKRSRS